MANNKTILEDLDKYCSPNSILIIDKQGILRKLICPFKVYIIIETQGWKKGQQVYVQAVKISDTLILLYLIGKTLYPYYLLAIIL